MEAQYVNDVAEMIMCGGTSAARYVHDTHSPATAELAAVDALLMAVEYPNACTMRHTGDVAAMLFSDRAGAALTMHTAYVTAEFERENLGASEANMLDLYLAGCLLIADAARREMALDLPV